MSGKNNTLIGAGIPEAFRNGSGNTVITDTSFLMGRGGVAIGTGAKADPTSVAIGAGAGAGLGVTQVDIRAEVLRTIKPILTGDVQVSEELKHAAIQIVDEIQKAKPDRGILRGLLKSFSALATIDGVAGIADRLCSFF